MSMQYLLGDSFVCGVRLVEKSRCGKVGIIEEWQMEGIDAEAQAMTSESNTTQRSGVL